MCSETLEQETVILPTPGLFSPTQNLYSGELRSYSPFLAHVLQTRKVDLAIYYILSNTFLSRVFSDIFSA